MVKHELDRSDPTQAIIGLYLDTIPHAFRQQSVFGFIGPGDGNEIFAMDIACQIMGVRFTAVQVDRPDSFYGVIPRFPALRADYTEQTDDVLSFFSKHSVTTLIMRNPPIVQRSITPIHDIFKYAESTNRSMLFTCMNGDFNRQLHDGLIEEGAQYRQRAVTIALSDYHIYTI